MKRFVVLLALASNGCVSVFPTTSGEVITSVLQAIVMVAGCATDEELAQPQCEEVREINEKRCGKNPRRLGCPLYGVPKNM